MTMLSEFIKEASDLLTQHGDHPVVNAQDPNCGMFTIEFQDEANGPEYVVD